MKTDMSIPTHLHRDADARRPAPVPDRPQGAGRAHEAATTRGERGPGLLMAGACQRTMVAAMLVAALWRAVAWALGAPAGAP